MPVPEGPVNEHSKPKSDPGEIRSSRDNATIDAPASHTRCPKGLTQPQLRRCVTDTNAAHQLPASLGTERISAQGRQGLPGHAMRLRFPAQRSGSNRRCRIRFGVQTVILSIGSGARLSTGPNSSMACDWRATPFIMIGPMHWNASRG